MCMRAAAVGACRRSRMPPCRGDGRSRRKRPDLDTATETGRARRCEPVSYGLPWCAVALAAWRQTPALTCDGVALEVGPMRNHEPCASYRSEL